MRSGVVLLVCVALLTTVGADIGRRHAMVSRRKQGKLLAHMPSVSRANVNALRRNAHAVVHKAGQLALHPPPAASPLNTSASPSPPEATPVNASQPASQPQPQPVLATHGAHTMHSGRNPRHSLHIATHEKIQAKRSAARVGDPPPRFPPIFVVSTLQLGSGGCLVRRVDTLQLGSGAAVASFGSSCGHAPTRQWGCRCRAPCRTCGVIWRTLAPEGRRKATRQTPSPCSCMCTSRAAPRCALLPTRCLSFA